MSMSNIEYSALKKRKGLHNWGFMPSRKEAENELEFRDEETDMDLQNFYSPEIVQQNSLGEYYALQDYEE